MSLNLISFSLGNSILLKLIKLCFNIFILFSYSSFSACIIAIEFIMLISFSDKKLVLLKVCFSALFKMSKALLVAPFT
ncbi:Uncharacterised protein [Streptococcus pneumoniae]|nr:Uncharacterised protein [Streptococcus pneumoniae]